MSRLIPDFFHWATVAAIFGLAAVFGFMAGDGMSAQAADQVERRQQIEDACMAGNANACLVFQAKHGKCAR